MATSNESSLITALEMVVLERQAEGTFVHCGTTPVWVDLLNHGMPDAHEPFRIEMLFPFLEVFLPDAESVWRDGQPPRLDSDLWCETATDGQEIPLIATALHLGSHGLLVIIRCDELFHDHRLLLQRARELRFTYDALAREMEQKDILMHCIVHDLASPLQTILGVLSAIDERNRPGDEAVMLHHALDAALRQRAMIREILNVFASEHDDADPPREDTVDLCAVIDRVVPEYAVSARHRNVSIEREVSVPKCLVHADEPRLIRVLSNLLDNAIRHSPVGRRIRVSVRDEGATVEVSIQDEGKGVPASLGPHLFQRFGRGIGPEAGTGLGLYFCRITVERWGGSIGYAAPETGGARFWFRLRKDFRQNEGPNARK